MLGDRHAGARDNEGGAGRDVDRARAVATGAHDITGSILARIADTAPVISSTVSPRTRSAINRPPICEGVASPDIRLSKAVADSSRDSVAPVATLPMIDLRSSIALTLTAGRRR